MAPTIMGISKEGYKVISADSLHEDSFVHQTPKIIHPALGPGPNLDSLNRRALQILAESLAETSTGAGPVRLKMYEWISRQVMMATTQAIYGPGNPFQDSKSPHVDFRKYEKGLIPLMMGTPSLFAHEYLAAREYLAKVYENYYANDGPSDPDASAYIKARYQFGRERGLTTPDIARAEVASSIALIGNTMPATFWLVYHILSDPAVLEDCRRELSGAVSHEGGVSSVDISRVKSACPILLSTFQEVMRFHGIGMSARTVLEDSTLDNQYLLKKGAIVLIPAIATHNLASVWGNNVGEFYHKRFFRGPGSKGRRHDPMAFRGFGGGATLCPGRHFAATEILAFASLIILSFDVHPVDGQWVAPTIETSNLGTAIDQPDHDIDIEVTPRNTKTWAITVSGATKEMSIVAEGIANNHN
ncbi:hypothetical protein G7054_g8015 [Neopestalotiopsis clavispora]|nr:hypothetical protein G7054_g8015 [Neopestalotiopsis clavispora]